MATCDCECDICHREAESLKGSAHPVLPDGWARIRLARLRDDPPDGRNISFVVCSVTCALTVLRAGNVKEK